MSFMFAQSIAPSLSSLFSSTWTKLQSEIANNCSKSCQDFAGKEQSKKSWHTESLSLSTGGIIKRLVHIQLLDIFSL